MSINSKHSPAWQQQCTAPPQLWMAELIEALQSKYESPHAEPGYKGTYLHLSSLSTPCRLGRLSKCHVYCITSALQSPPSSKPYTLTNRIYLSPSKDTLPCEHRPRLPDSDFVIMRSMLLGLTLTPPSTICIQPPFSKPTRPRSFILMNRV